MEPASFDESFETAVRDAMAWTTSSVVVWSGKILVKNVCIYTNSTRSCDAAALLLLLVSHVHIPPSRFDNAFQTLKRGQVEDCKRKQEKKTSFF